ncbi:MAG: cytochrome-c peroxidase [Candidatus Competibacteraceae bacterium]|nr:cytochrome-c peroxidase [Candidatus Competibacteraceae bacterium]
MKTVQGYALCLVMGLGSLAVQAQVADTDGDGIADAVDNCRTVANPAQLDSNGDSYGNMCDADLNNDCISNFADLGLLKAAFGSTSASNNWNEDADLNGDGVVNFGDLGLMKQGFGQAPGPAGQFQCGAPVLPAATFDYVNYAETSLPDHFTNPLSPGNVSLIDNQTLVNNDLTNPGATLGRVLFYDKRLSVNNTVACASCHEQALGFDDPDRFSTGVNGQTGRHAMPLANNRFYGGAMGAGPNSRMFWDERAASQEAQALMPIQDPVEMGHDLVTLAANLSATDFYPPLFSAAFGDPAITPARIGAAIAQFERSMASYQSKFDLAYTIPDPNGLPPPNLAVFTPVEARGAQLFGMPGLNGGGILNCGACHDTVVQQGEQPRNNGLDPARGAPFDPGTGAQPGGMGAVLFKVASLRNVGVREHFMHDGRFSSLEEVVEHYNSGVLAHPDLHPILQDVNGNPQQLNLSEADKAALVAFMNTLTDPTFLTAPQFSDPFINDPF